MTTPETDPRERLVVPVTPNADLHASRFCIEQCGIYGDAQEQAVIWTAMMGGGSVAASFSETEVSIQTTSQEPLPKIVMTCKGPRRQFLVFGDLVCRKNAKIDTA